EKDCKVEESQARILKGVLNIFCDGRKIRCWPDPWIPNVEVLANLIPGLSSLNMDCLLSDMVLGDGRWNLDLFRIWLPEEHRLRAKEEMVRSGILHVCGHISEDILHVLKDCIATRSIWDCLIHVEWHIRNSAINSQDSNLWLHVDGNWVCLYTDGSVQNDGSFAAAGGITNSHGKWILGYNRYLEFINYWSALVTSIFVTSLDRETKMRID
ncbi:hypothetical protein Goari_027147, partial [Gossypium aridum]|nr:hypothetical protein [Gossypium aridum]